MASISLSVPVPHCPPAGAECGLTSRTDTSGFDLLSQDHFGQSESHMAPYELEDYSSSVKNATSTVTGLHGLCSLFGRAALS